VTLPLAVALAFVAALVLLALPNRARNAAAAIAGVATLGATALLATQVPAIFSGQVVEAGWAWLPMPGADFGFRADGLALVFALLVSTIGALVILYARYYLGDDEPVARFHAFFMLFMGSMLGVVLAGNLLLLAVFWELTSLSSFLLIGYWQKRADARQGARMALAVTGTGGLCLLAGVLLLGRMAGSYDLDVVLASGDAIRAHPLYLPMLLLVLTGAFTKSAQFPFHFWLPSAMAAPTPVSAYLHSATMVKAGVFLVARLHPALAGTDAWFFVVTLTGLATLLVGAYVAVFQHDLKGLLAYSTISHLGLIMLLFGLDSPLAPVAGVFHILNHATFKASLFMAAGIIDHESGSRDMRRLHGLRKLMPVTAVLAIVASAAMAGVPLLNGFLSKEMFLAETLQLGGRGALEVLVPLVATLAAAFSVAYSVRFIHDVFWNGEPRDLPRAPHDPPFWMLVPVGVLAAACLLVGVLPERTIGAVLGTAAAAVVGGPLPSFKLAVWHGLNLPLLMSALALGLGAAFYFSLRRLTDLHELVHLPRGGKDVFDALLGGLLRAARAATRVVANGSLQRSLLCVVAAAVLAAGWPLLAGGLSAGTVPATPATGIALLLWGLGVLGIAGVVLMRRQRFVALVFVGLTGLVVSVAFALLSAPDLALTQLLVEVASVVLLMLALYWLPQSSPPEPGRLRLWRDGALAAAAGLGVAAVTYAVLTRPADGRLAEWLLANAKPGAAGANAVNVIIVDFRAFDTLGEITVFGVAGLIVAALLAGFRPEPGNPRTRDAGAASRPEGGPSLMLSTASQVLLPLAVVIAIWFFLRGHNAPGGGFIAGLALALGLLVPYVAYGDAWMTARLRGGFQPWIAAGLAIAALTGFGSFLFDHPFMTSAYVAPSLPVIGKVSIATAMFFDIGVFLVVTGATMVALTALGRLGAHARGGDAVPAAGAP
jgi:multicomponent K+:H+ antiporter subunit A